MTEISNKMGYIGVEAANTESSNSTVALTPATGAVANNDETTVLKAEIEKLKADYAKLEKNKKTSIKQKTPYNKVVERFRSSFGAQAIKTEEAKKVVFKKIFEKNSWYFQRGILFRV